jgi:CMP-N-acetylneuraminic acid synthetase
MEVGLYNKKILAVIPARAGSKRLPNKNMMELRNKPLIQWTIDAALACKELSKVVVSTDSKEIALFSENIGATVPFLRPDNISGDKASGIDVVLHVIDFYKKQNITFDYIMLLQPTSPLRTSAHIKSAINELKSKKSDAIISVCECDHPPQWSNTLDKNHSMDNFISEFVKNNSRSQDLASYYRLNGAIYLVNIKKFLEANSFFLSNNSHAFIMPIELSVDIDNLIDFKYADLTMNENKY